MGRSYRNVCLILVYKMLEKERRKKSLALTFICLLLVLLLLLCLLVLLARPAVLMVSSTRSKRLISGTWSISAKYLQIAAALIVLASPLPQPPFFLSSQSRSQFSDYMHSIMLGFFAIYEHSILYAIRIN